MLLLSFSSSAGSSWSLVIAVLVVKAVEVVSDNCCGSSCNSCNWENACDNGADLKCMDRIAGNLVCRDYSACKDFNSCTEAEAARRSGQLCNGFPWYNGGYPMANIAFDNEVKQYRCNQTDSSAKYCSSWSTTANSIDEFEIGAAVCKQESSNSDYCQAWTEVTSEYKKCFYEPVYTDHGVYFSEVCCNEENSGQYLCCQQQCNTAIYSARQPQIEELSCQCIIPSNNSKFCWQWYCEQTSLFNYYSKYPDPIEYEWYTCLAASDNGLHCTQWSGDANSVEEFEVSLCNCIDEVDDYCITWTCNEKGIDYWWPNLLWTILSCIFSLLMQSYFVYRLVIWDLDKNTFAREMAIYYLSTTFLCGGFIVIGVWKAGLFVFFVAGSQVFGLPICILLVKAGKRMFQILRERRLMAYSSNPRRSMTPGSNVSSTATSSAPRVNAYDHVTHQVSIEYFDDEWHNSDGMVELAPVNPDAPPLVDENNVHVVTVDDDKEDKVDLGYSPVMASAKIVS